MPQGGHETQDTEVQWSRKYSTLKCCADSEEKKKIGNMAKCINFHIHYLVFTLEAWNWLGRDTYSGVQFAEDFFFFFLVDSFFSSLVVKNTCRGEIQRKSPKHCFRSIIYLDFKCCFFLLWKLTISSFKWKQDFYIICHLLKRVVLLLIIPANFLWLFV